MEDGRKVQDIVVAEGRLYSYLWSIDEYKHGSHRELSAQKSHNEQNIVIWMFL